MTKRLVYISSSCLEQGLPLHNRIVLRELTHLRWLEREQISEPKLVPKLKIELSSIISLKMIRKSRPFYNGILIRQLLKKSWQRLNYNTKFIESFPFSDKSDCSPLDSLVMNINRISRLG